MAADLSKMAAIRLGLTAITKVYEHVIAVYSENKLQHYATACRNHKGAGEKLGLFRFCQFLCIFICKYIKACSEITF